jgi:hypothetical protein
MNHPNEDFIKKIFTKRAIEQRYLPGKNEITKLYQSLKENSTNFKTLDEGLQNKVNSFINRSPNKLNNNQQINDWVLFTNPYGVFYYSKSRNAWANSFGKIASTLEQLIGEMVDLAYSNEFNKKSTINLPPLPEPTSALDYEVWATSFVDDPPDWDTESYSTFGIVPMPALTTNVFN